MIGLFFAELPGLLSISDVAEALMYVPNGPWLLCRLVANSPDSFKQGKDKGLSGMEVTM